LICVHSRLFSESVPCSTRLPSPITDLDRPWGVHEVEAPRFQDSLRMMVVRSALRTGCLYPTSKYSWYSFLLEVESTPRAIVRTEGFIHSFIHSVFCLDDRSKASSKTIPPHSAI